MKWIILLGITSCLFLLFLAKIWIIVSKAKKKKYIGIREQFAFRCVLLLLGIAGDMIVGLLNPYSLWDLAAKIFGFENMEPYGITVIRWVLASAIFAICCWLVYRTYTHWEGTISRRQYWSDVRGLNETSMLRDFLSVVRNTFLEDSNLKEYKRFSDSLDYRQEETGGDIPWYMEFVHIYRINSNQALIDIQQDWHSYQHCFIFSYATAQKVAACCLDTMPDDGQIHEFLNYIYQLHENYFKIIVAVKEGKEKSYSKKIGEIAVEFLFKEDMLDNLVDFTGYYRAIDDLYHRPLPQGTGMRIEDVYVALNCCINEDVNPLPLESYVLEWLEESNLEQLAILGDFGMGKTIFSTSLAYHMIKKSAQRVPVLIPLRNKSPRNSNANEIFSYFTAQYGIHPNALNILNANGKLLLIFDGFDEMDLVGNDDIRKLHFRSLWSLITPKSKILITGRPNYFLSQSEMYSALGVRMGTDALPSFKTLSLQLFTKTQIRGALRNAKPAVQAGICHVVDSNVSSSFSDLIRRPSHLFLVSQIWESRHLADKVQNLTSASILNEFLLSNFERQAAKGTQNPYFYLSPIEREYFMIGVAMRMYKMGVTAITREFFEETIVELVDIFPEQLSRENPIYLDLRNGKSVKAFAQADSESMLAIMNDVRTCGILINDYANDGFCFAHKSLYDLLVAKYFQGQYLKQYDSAMTISKTLSLSSSYNARLGSDMVIRKLTAELISEKISATHKPENPKVMCTQIFDQCWRTIARWPGRSSPQNIFRRCLKRQSSGEYKMGPIQIRYKIRLLVLFPVIAVLTFFLFLFKGHQVTDKLARRAALYYYAELPAKLDIENAMGEVPAFNIHFLVAAVIIVIVAILFYIYFSFRQRTVKLDELILLTWYYACIDHQISKKTICSLACPGNLDIFADYINGYNFAQLQEKMQNKKKPNRKK